MKADKSGRAGERGKRAPGGAESAGQLDLFGGRGRSVCSALDRSSAEIERCLKCGLCRAACPVFAETLDESAGARGRIAMVEALREETLGLSPLFADRLSKCLNCKSCMEACPSGIEVDRIVLAARAEIFQRGRFPLLKKLIFRHLLRRGRLLPPVGRVLAFVERKILRGLPPSSPYRMLLPMVNLDRERILPVFAERPLTDEYAEVVTPERKPRMRVGFFTGCATNLIYTAAGRAVVRALVGEGIEVVIPKGQGCCGMPAYSAGDRETGLVLAEQNLRAFRNHKMDAIVTACASCGAALKHDYEKILEVKSADLGARVYDFSEFLVKFSKMKFNEAPDRSIKVTFHYPCHLSRGQKIREAPARILDAIPHVGFVEMEEADRCCGGGGAFSLSHYDLSKAIGTRKAGFIAATGAEAVATACPSCIMQLEDMLHRSGLPQRVVHIAELVAECYPPLEETAESGLVR
jgi:glycolate oxidase iron-sulfur subunit